MKRYKVVMAAEIELDMERFDAEWAGGYDAATFLGLGLFDKDAQVLSPKVEGIFRVAEYLDDASSMEEIQG